MGMEFEWDTAKEAVNIEKQYPSDHFRAKGTT
jgi:uncharacterized DUF497 family protein